MTSVKARAAARPGRRFARRHATLVSFLIATASTIVVFGTAAIIIVNSPGWPEVKADFFNWTEFKTWFRPVLDAFWLNVKIFTVCEIAVLVCAMGIAVLRSLPGPVFFPLRAFAVVYADLFRGVPTIIVIYLLGFGVPGLQLSGVPNDPVFWGAVALVLVYTAYVAEVYRAGIESVHPSQEAAARSLGLTRGQSLRFVVIPQAVRRVVPPLLNDFIGLQKDTALVGLLGPVEAFNMSNISAQGDANFTPYLIAAVLFLSITVPLTRFTDWLIDRQRRARQVSRAA
jgi:polar amino acid transport system permease protein